jgi:hypothetical protein
MSNDMIQITTNAGFFAQRFQRYLQRSIQISRRSVEAVVKEQAKGLIRNAFRYTPPMAGRSFAKGYSASKKAITNTVYRALVMRNEATVARSLQTVRRDTRRAALQQLAEQLAVEPSALVQFIKRNQKPDKHYPDRAPKHFSTIQKRKEVIALLEKTIGATAAGWCAAAAYLGVTFPDWVARWRSRNNGNVSLQISGNVIQFKARNPNRHTDSATIQRALDSAYDRQAEAMRRRLISAIAAGVLRREDVFGR